MRDDERNQRLRELDELPFNYDASQYVAGQAGWNVDSYSAKLPREAAGPPTPGGSFEVAKQVLIEYRFPDPRRLVGFFPSWTALSMVARCCCKQSSCGCDSSLAYE